MLDTVVKTIDKIGVTIFQMNPKVITENVINTLYDNPKFKKFWDELSGDEQYFLMGEITITIKSLLLQIAYEKLSAESG
jgi:hypothetical protein